MNRNEKINKLPYPQLFYDLEKLEIKNPEHNYRRLVSSGITRLPKNLKDLANIVDTEAYNKICVEHKVENTTPLLNREYEILFEKSTVDPEQFQNLHMKCIKDAKELLGGSYVLDFFTTFKHELVLKSDSLGEYSKRQIKKRFLTGVYTIVKYPWGIVVETNGHLYIIYRQVYEVLPEYRYNKIEKKINRWIGLLQKADAASFGFHFFVPLKSWMGKPLLIVFDGFLCPRRV